MTQKRIRWNVYIPEDIAAQYSELAEEFGLSKGQFSLMVMKMGYEAFLRAYKPEKVISEDMWVRMVENYEKKTKQLEEAKSEKMD